MFESIQQSLSDALRNLRGGTKFTEANMREGLVAVRRALLEADVNLEVADRFLSRVEASAMGRQVLKSINPSQQIVEVVYEELVGLMGPVDPRLRMAKGRPTVIMMCGLQGTGKTTTCGKLARLFASQNVKPLLVAADLQRPAAIEQLKVIGQQLNIPVYSEEKSDPIKVCHNAIQHAKNTGRDLVILDTAGRLAIDQELMDELKNIDRKVSPDQCFLVVDAQTGQDAVESARRFNDMLELDAVILTKLDGDARGGAALSIKEVTGVPIKFAGMGEKLDQLEPFRPEGMASRILGMGDIISLVSKAREQYNEEEAAAQQKKLEGGKFDLNDFREHIKKMKMMGSMRNLMELIPGLNRMLPEFVDPDQELKRFQGILDSMTPKERANPDMIDISRRRRIAKGSGSEPHEINRMIKQFEQMRSVMKNMSGMSTMDRMRQFMGMAQGGMAGLANPAGPGLPTERAKPNAQAAKDNAKARKAERQNKKKNRKRK